MHALSFFSEFSFLHIFFRGASPKKEQKDVTSRLFEAVCVLFSFFSFRVSITPTVVFVCGVLSQPEPLVLNKAVFLHRYLRKGVNASAE